MSYSLAIYFILTIWELYLFVTQRAALEFSRSMNVTKNTGNHMLPTWYVSFWPNKIARWVSIYFVYQDFGLVISIILLVVPFLTTIFIPIPYKHLLPKFEKVLLRDISMNNIDPQLQLYMKLNPIRKKIGLPKKGKSEEIDLKNTHEK